MPDQREGLGDERCRRGHGRIVLGRGLPGHCADREVAVLALDAGQLADPVEVDDVREAGEPHRQQGHEALPAREDLGVIAVLSEQRRDVGHRLGGVVFERSGLHRQLRQPADGWERRT